MAARLAQDHTVLPTDVKAELLAEVAEKLAADGAKVVHAVCDVSDRAAVQAADAVAEEQLGEVTSLANVAGVGMFHPATELTEKMWDRTAHRGHVGPNLRGQHPRDVPDLPGSGPPSGRPSGAIVNIASVRARLGLEMVADYGSAKAAVIELTHSLARIGAPTGLRAKRSCPN